MNSTQSTNVYHQIAVKVPIPDYKNLLKIVGPHVKISSLMRELIRNFIESQQKKAS